MPDPRDLRGRSPGQPGSAGHPAHPSHNGGPTGHPAGQPHRTRAQERIDELDVSPSRLVAEIEALKTELAASNAKAD